MIDAIDRLRRFPYLGSRVRGLTDVRQFVHRPMVIQYRVWEADGIVEILKIRHSARRPKS
jgi:plasmid stabilization system protein ParE